MSALLKVSLEKGVIATPENHKKTVRALGFTKRHQTRIFKDSPSIRGMLNNVIYLLKVEEISAVQEAPATAFSKKPEYILGDIKVKTAKEKKSNVKSAESSSDKKDKKVAKVKKASAKVSKATVEKKKTAKVKK